MKNPFQYGGVVRGDAFCNRRKEVEDLSRAMESGEKLFVYSAVVGAGSDQDKLSIL